jgi:esterase/lipase superfamily enzyme
MAPDTDEEVLNRQVYVGDRYKRFAELTSDDARALAEQFSGLSGGGLEGKVAPVGMAWRELADLMEEGGAARVADLGAKRAAALAERLRVVPPGGGWLSG